MILPDTWCKKYCMMVNDKKCKILYAYHLSIPPSKRIEVMMKCWNYRYMWE